VKEDEVFDIVDVGDFSTFISTLRKYEILAGSVGDYLSSTTVPSSS